MSTDLFLKPAEINIKPSLLSGKRNGFKFIDLFAGIGGFHLAFSKVGGECVFASEWDPNARKTYEHNFSKIHPKLFRDGMFAGDITKVEPVSIPDFDILTGGFPCQPFSQAGYKKGFEDSRGTLFFNVANIIKAKQPAAFFIENVRHLLKHDDGRTFATIKRIIENDLDYSFHYCIIKASDFGLPQYRPRLFMVGFKNKEIPFKFPEPVPLQVTMSDIFGGKCSRSIGYTLRVGGRGSGLNDRRNWDSYLVDGKVRRLGSEEGKKMMGFPENFEFPVSHASAMRQLGNSVAVNAVHAVAERMIDMLEKYHAKRK
jgi:DNA (cytosine-5)-methyltransferase 1